MSNSIVLKLPQQLLLEWIKHCQLFIMEYVPIDFQMIQLDRLHYEMARSIFITFDLMLDKTIFPCVTLSRTQRIYHELTRNPQYTMHFIEFHLEFEWDWYIILSTYDISLEKVMNLSNIIDMKFHNVNRKFDIFSRNIHLKLETILKHPEISWDWSAVSRNLNMTANDIRFHQDVPWNYFCLSQSPNIDMQLVLDLPSRSWDWHSLSCNSSITMENIESHPDLPWDYGGIASNENLNMHAVACIPFGYRRITWFRISSNPGITVDDILTHIEYPWQWQFVSKNTNLTLDVVLSHPDKDWCWKSISEHPNITADDILHHPELPWVWRYVSYNPNLTMDVIKRYPDKPWNWGLDDFGVRTVRLYNIDDYIKKMCSIYSVISMHDEDYDRGEECLDYDNVVDLVIQNEFCISSILDYI